MDSVSGNRFDSKDYKRSRAAYNTQCAVEYFVQLLATDAFLAKLLKHVGLSDAAAGVVCSFFGFAFLFELFSIFLMSKRVDMKRTVILFDTIGILFFALTFLTPFLPFSQPVKSFVVVAGVFAGFFCKFGIMTMYFKWANSFVAPEQRARFSALKEMISLIAGIIFTLIVGFIMDRFEAAGNLRGAFLFISAAVFVISVCSFITLKLIAPLPPEEKTEDSAPPFREVLKNTLGNADFRRVTVMSCLWCAAQYMITGFLGTFKTQELLLTAGYVQVINTLGNLGRFAASRPIGAFSDRTSFARGYRLGVAISAAGFLLIVFTTSKTWWLIIPATILHFSGLAGTGQNDSNIIYSYVDSGYFVQALAIKNGFAGIVCFLSALAGGKILSAVQANGNMILGIPLYGQQLLALLAVLLAVADVIYTKFVVEKMKIRKQ